VAAAFDDPTVDGVYGDLLYVRRNDSERVLRHWRAGRYSRGKLAWGWLPPHPALFLRRQVYERFGLFDTTYRIAADYDFMLRVLNSGIRVEYLPGVLVKMRVGGMSNRSLANVLRKSAEDYRALTTNHVGGLPALAWKNLSKLPQFRLAPWPWAARWKALRGTA
jgi:GT2 family glycosyltransferase